MAGITTGDGESFAVMCHREDGRWHVELLPGRLVSDVDGLTAVVRGTPSEVPAMAWVDVGDDFFVIARHLGGRDALLLSDVTAAAVDDLARDVCARLGVDPPGDDDMEDVWPAGDLDILTDLGMGSMEVGALLSDLDAYADEQLLAIARRLGFGSAFSETVDVLVR